MLANLMNVENIDLDQSRLARSLTLYAERTGDGRYRIAGGAQEHWVDLKTPAHPRCDCGDHLWRDALCKHIIAALLREGNEPVLRAVGTLFSQLQGRQV